MNSVKIAYLILNVVYQLAMIGLAVTAPIMITPGYYWWTAFAVFCSFASGHALGGRMNAWGLGE